LAQLGRLWFSAGLEMVTRRALAGCVFIEVHAETNTPPAALEIWIIERGARTRIPGDPHPKLEIEFRERVVTIVITPRLREVDIGTYAEPTKIRFPKAKRKVWWDGEASPSSLVLRPFRHLLVQVLQDAKQAAMV
jgi:hypothetical protein